MAYFLLAVSNRLNLELCIKHALAGFTDSINGLWTFLDIHEGDYVSFLYGARVHNLYEVQAKAAYKNADRLPPWPPVRFRPSGKTYHFPFRLELRPVRAVDEGLVRPQFQYVAENLLLRGGYRKTHFQADQTTLQNVSEMGVPSSAGLEPLDLTGAETFTPKLVMDKRAAQPPEVFPLGELVLQTLIRSYLSDEANLNAFLVACSIRGIEARRMEVLGEKAFPEGHVDILIKDSTPIGIARRAVVEVKRGKATNAHLRQLKLYMDRLGEECAGGVLVARDFSRRTAQRAAAYGVSAACYAFGRLGEGPFSYDDLRRSLDLEVLSGD